MWYHQYNNICRYEEVIGNTQEMGSGENTEVFQILLYYLFSMLSSSPRKRGENRRT